MQKTTQSSAKQNEDEIKTQETSDATDRRTDESDIQPEQPAYEEIAVRAYYCWLERGCPDISPEVDWQRAEQEMRAEKAPVTATSKAANA